MITAIIITRDEQLHIGRCIERLVPLADRILIVDSFSSDKTVEMARAAGVEVMQHEFASHAAQFQWGIDQLGDDQGWIVRVDADEWFEPAAIVAIKERTAAAPTDLAAFDIRRKVIFRGRWIRWGGYYQTVLTRIWRTGAARIEQRLMDEHIIIERGRVERITEGDIVDENLKDLTDWTDKHNSYATRQMVEMVDLGKSPVNSLLSGRLSNSAKWKRRLRNGFYARFPLYLRAYLYFFWRYVIRLGFLDGREGLVFHTLQGFWQFFLVDAKIDEARLYITAHGIDAFRDHLWQRHRLKIAGPGD